MAITADRPPLPGGIEASGAPTNCAGGVRMVWLAAAASWRELSVD